MIYSSQDIEQKKLKLVILGQLLLFIPQKTPKIKILENEKICWRYHHFTDVHSEIQSETDKKILSFWAIFYLFTFLKKLKKPLET